MDTAVAIRTLEATYKSSADAAAVETMILRLTEKVLIYFFLNSCCFDFSSFAAHGYLRGIFCCMLTFLDEIASTGRSTSQKQGKGRKCHANSSINLAIIINHVKGMEILLASSRSVYASYALYWYCVFGLGAFFVIGCGKFLSITITL